MLAARPVATSIISARSSAGSLPSGPTIRQTPFSSAVTDAASKRALVMTVMPRWVKLRSSTLLTSASSSGTIGGRYSSSVTFDPDVVVHAGELDADRAGPDDDDVLGQRVHLEDVVAGDDPLAVGLEAGQRLDARAGGEDDVGRVQDALAAGARACRPRRAG